MAEKFDVAERHKLDNPRRREMLPPEEVMGLFNLTPGDIMADIGCGIGYFTFPAARLTGPVGKVYALDISTIMLAEVIIKQRQEDISNIETLQTGEYDLRLTAESVNIGFMCNVLHEIEDQDRFLQEIHRILKNKGRLLVIEWQKKPGTWGPPVEERIAEQDMVSHLKKNGFVNITVQPLKTDFYTVQAYKN
jgi:ubiquinone/menaquinone biosynthesis C-methylase UbiE